MADGRDLLLGNLTLDISSVRDSVNEVNEMLGKLGVGVDFDITKVATDAINKEIKKLKEEIEKNVKESNDALEKLGQTPMNGSLTSEIEKVTSVVKTVKGTYDEATGAMVQHVTAVVSGFDKMGNKAREYHNEQGQITKQTIDVGAAAKDMLNVYDQLYQKRAKLYELEQNGQAGTPQYQKMANDIEQLNIKLSQFNDATAAVVSKSASLATIQERFRKMKDAIDEAAQLKEVGSELDALVGKYQQYYDLKSKQISAVHAGNTDLADHYRTEAEAIWDEIGAIEKDNEVLASLAATHEKVTAAMESYYNAVRTGESKGEAFANKADAEQLKALISLYEEYYNARSKAIQSDTRGNEANTAMWTATAESIKAEIDAIAGENTALNENAIASEKVAAAKQQMQAAINDNALKQEEADARATKEAIEAYAEALAALLNAQAKVNEQMASGKLQEGTEEYDKAQASLDRLNAVSVQAASALDATGRAAAEGMGNVQNAIDRLAQSEARLNDQSQVDYLALTKAAYKDLTNAITQYNAAKKAGDTESMAYWQEQITGSASVISNMGNIIGQLNLEEGERKQILDLIQQAQTAQMGMNNTQSESKNLVGQWGTQLTSMMTRYVSLLAIIRSIKDILSDAVEYVSKFHDQMNEIQMITGKSDSEIENLANTYRGLASEMSVSSTQMAEAAIYFTRQGLQTGEIEDRLRNTTQYAKAANIEFTTAAELITAVVNSMNLAEEATDGERSAAQRVADVFMAVGDNAATSGEEIGTAMQKAAAAAGAFGVDFEWLAAYIATVSETTRQEASTIGTAFNTLIARLHSIRTTGYNSEDETKINDIAKALNTINVALLDQEGNWRDMTDIFNDIAAQWDGLSGKQQSYIATTMAGVKQQNTFLALMSDLSKGIENGSRAWELYEVAMDSAGTAAKKYAVYMDSVEASQNKLTIAQENFYSILNAGVIKDWNNMLAQGISGFANAIKELTLSNYTKYGEKLQDTLSQIQSLRNAQSIVNDIYSEFGSAIDNNTAPIGNYISRLESIENVSPRVAQAVEDLKNGVITQAEAFREITGAIDGYIDAAEQLSMLQLQKKYKDWQPTISEYDNQISLLKGAYGFDINSPSSFVTALQNFWEHPASFTEQFGIFNAEMNNAATQLQKQMQTIMLELFDTTKLGVGQWEILGQQMWQSFYNGFGTSANDYQGELKAHVDAVVQDLINTLYTGTNPFIEQAFGDWLTDVFTNMDPSRWSDTITWIINDVAARGVENVLPDNALVEAMANQLLGDNLLEYVRNNGQEYGDEIIASMYTGLGDALGSIQISSEMVPDILKKMFEPLLEENPEFIQEITQSYKDLLAAGLSQIDIKSIFNELPIDQWTDAYESAYDIFLGRIMDNAGVDELMGEFWSDLDLGTMSTIAGLTEAGTTIQEIENIMANSSSVEEFAEKIRTVGKSAEDLSGSGEEAIDWAKKFKDSVDSVNKMDDAISKLKEGKAVSTDDLFDLAKVHPEIYSAIDDTEKLIAVLERLKNATKVEAIGDLSQVLLSDEGWFSRTEWANNTAGAKTGNEYLGTLEAHSVEWYKVHAAAVAAAEALYGYNDANEQADEGNKETAKSAKEMADEITNTNKEISTLDSAIKTLESTNHLSLSDMLGIATLHPEIMAVAGDTQLLIEELKQLKEESQSDLTEGIAQWLANSEAFMENSPFAGKGATINEYMESLLASPGGIIENSEAIAEVTAYLDQAAANVLNASEEMEAATETWLEAQAKAAEEDANANWAKSNNYAMEIAQMQKALADDSSGKKALEVFNGYSDAIKQGIASTFPNLVRSLSQVEKAQEKVTKAQKNTEDSSEDLTNAMDESSDAASQMGKELEKAEKYAKAKYFKDTANAIKELEEGTISATDAYEVFNKECDKITKAGDEIVKAEKKISDGTELVESDVNDLATVLGVSAQSIIDDFPGAVDTFNQLIAAGGSLESMFNALNEAAFIRITGTSVADFSALQNGLLSVEGLAKEVIEMLVATGQWELDELELPQKGFVLDPDQGWIESDVMAHATVLKPTGNNPFGSGSGVSDSSSDTKSSGGGGGGGGGSSNYTYVDPTVTHNAEEAMDRITRVLGIQKEAFEDAAKSSRFYGMSIAEMMQSMYNGNVDLLARPLVDAAELVKKGWEDAGEGIATVFSTTYEHQIEDVYFGINLTPILPNGEVLTEEELNDYFDELVDGATSMSDILSRDAAENGGMNLVINIVEAESMDEAIDHAVELAEELHELQEEYYLTEDATEDMTDATEDMTEATDEDANVVPALTVKLKSLGQSVNYTTEQLNDMAKAISELSNADLIDIMERVQTIIGYQQGYYQAKQSYYEQTGQMQGYIAYLDEERELLEEQNEVLKDNIAALEVKMEATETALNGMSKEDEGYQELKEDLEKLQDTHASYTQTVIENDTAILKLAEDAKDAADEIRQMEIDIRQLIYDAIEDRENKRTSMRDARISMEDEILSHIKANYEKEKDAILDASDAQIDALNDEKDAIKDNYDAQIDAIKDEKDQYKDMMDDRIDALKDEKDAYSDMMSARIEALNEEKNLLQEQLDLRKQQNEEQDKQAQLEQLEIQYQQILADPTRAKDAQSIKSKIDKLRDEISWSDAEKAVKAQQNKIGDEIDSLNAEKSRTLELMDDEIAKVEEVRDATIQAMEDQISAIEDQRDAMIDSLEAQIDAMNDYKDYIEDFYDDLLDNSEQVMNEMANVMEMTDDEIIEWLKQNDETYAKASASTQEKMEEEWRDTLDEMHGNVKTYWDEVEEIFQQGDEAIIEFLKENSAEYAEAGKLQAEAYVDEWTEKLEELRRAYEDVAGEITQAPNYNTYVDAPTNSGESGEGSGSGGGGGGGSSQSGGGEKWHVSMAPNMTFTTEDEAKAYKTKMTNLAWNDWEADGEDSNLYNRYLQWSNSTVAKYIKGGLANSTGLAWLDGTPEEPERVLSPYQTQLFDTMVRALESAAMAPTYKMHNYGEWAAENEGSTSATFGDIIVNVDNLDTDDDYEELAEKVGDVLLEKIGETTVVGGIRLGRY